jgi:hypothetical protein
MRAPFTLQLKQALWDHCVLAPSLMTTPHIPRFNRNDHFISLALQNGPSGCTDVIAVLPTPSVSIAPPPILAVCLYINTLHFTPCLCFNLKIEATCSPETLVNFFLIFINAALPEMKPDCSDNSQKHHWAHCSLHAHLRWTWHEVQPLHVWRNITYIIWQVEKWVR